MDKRGVSSLVDNVGHVCFVARYPPTGPVA